MNFQKMYKFSVFQFLLSTYHYRDVSEGKYTYILSFFRTTIINIQMKPFNYLSYIDSFMPLTILFCIILISI